MAFVGILSQIKLLFGPLVIQLVRYILKQLFTSASFKVVDIYLAALRFRKTVRFSEQDSQDILSYFRAKFTGQSKPSSHVSRQMKSRITRKSTINLRSYPPFLYLEKCLIAGWSTIHIVFIVTQRKNKSTTI